MRESRKMEENELKKEVNDRFYKRGEQVTESSLRLALELLEGEEKEVTPGHKTMNVQCYLMHQLHNISQRGEEKSDPNGKKAQYLRSCDEQESQKKKGEASN